jgi:hypothetical protein
MTSVRQRHPRRVTVIVMAAILVAGALAVLAGAAPERASAAQRPAYGGSSVWTWKWETTPFAVSGRGVVDIWTTCRPKSNSVTWHELLVGTSDASWLRRINVRCDRQGHWVRRVGIPRNTRVTVLSHPFRSDGAFCYWPEQCATGWTSVYTSS